MRPLQQLAAYRSREVKLLALYGDALALADDRTSIFEEEAETGHLDHDAIWANEDSAAEFVLAFIDIMEGNK